jgi:methylenetetrahydrofolate reductase (NADPH)
MESLESVGVLGNVFILAGVAPIRSAKAAHMMNQVPGIKIPDSIIKRLEGSANPKEEGIQISLELIDQLKRLPGINGLHFMAVGWESIVPRVISESGLRKPASINS